VKASRNTIGEVTRYLEAMRNSAAAIKIEGERAAANVQTQRRAHRGTGRGRALRSPVRRGETMAAMERAMTAEFNRRAR
jgi:hypothetical protein